MLPPRLDILPALLREVVSSRTLPREPEPDLVMDSQAEVDAYTQAGRIDGIMSASYLFQTARISQTIQGAQRVLDLACGPATQLAQIAGMNPEITFQGIDLSAPMLGRARDHIAVCGLKNVSLDQGDITRLTQVSDQSVDAVISTMALHHLPTYQHLQACFREIARVLKPGGAVYLTDFSRFKSLKTVIFFAYMDRGNAPHLFLLDYERSLRAAFEVGEFGRAVQACLPAGTHLHATFAVPMLMVAKTPDRVLPEDFRARLRAMRAALPWRYRRDLDSIRVWFALGGLRADPFA